jgi:hypothetical protein
MPKEIALAANNKYEVTKVKSINGVKRIRKR